MKIIKKKIRTPEKYLAGITNGDRFYIGLLDIGNFKKQLVELGFTNDLNIGEQVLPEIVRSVSKFNANGGFKLRKDLPKETVYRDAEIKDWHGNTHNVSIPYQRYQRDIILPPSIELSIKQGGNNLPIVIAPILSYQGAQLPIIRHTINLFLEFFGECDVLLENLVPVFNVPVTKLNWSILPVGNFPWEVLQKNVTEIIDTIPLQRRKTVQHRIDFIITFNPDIVAVGKAGFKGYFILGFTNKNLFVLESIYTGNATYILGQKWAELSQLTKGEILNQSLHLDRFIHTQDWEKNISNLLRE